MNGKMNNMDQLIGLLLELAVVYFVVQVIFAYIAIGKQAKQAELAKQEQAQKDVELTIEVHGNTAYFFNKETNEFIAQGTNADELISHIVDRKFSNVKFLVDNKELAKVAWLDDVFKAHRIEA